ncbi:hypothetical protein B6N60_01278 [Richelia sinica FACHB-800]|uniref:DUF928 domain-containing protein n=2 Tax=Richelia TaxID=98443 RepID=A0A975T635_9NOST|nr:DUF928 domain-containing protein [Richelia sinica]QXE22595.1 hypothetical protein B6N60_01278 [Richelia sinica FACHB-800]
MNPKMNILQIKALTGGISTIIFTAASLPISTSAQLSPGMRVSLRFPPVAERGAPPRTIGTGVRGPACRTQDYKNVPLSTMLADSRIPLTALTPENNVVKTLSAHPSIYVYVPKTKDKQAEFRVLELQTETVVYKSQLALSNTPGIVKLSLPASVQLDAGKIYQWQFFVICDPNNREADEGVEGWFERATLSTDKATSIQQVEPGSLEQARLYVEDGLWDETLNILANLRDRNPQAQAAWVDLLDSVQLGALAKVSIIDCCRITSSPTEN